MLSPSILRCRRSTLLPLTRYVSSRRSINIGQGEPPDWGMTAGLCRRVVSQHDPRYLRPGEPLVQPSVRRLDYAPQPNSDIVDIEEQLPRITKYMASQRAVADIPGPSPDVVEQLPRITKHTVGQRAISYIPGSPPPIKIIKLAETTEVRKITLGPLIKRSFIRRTFHPLDKRSNVIEDGDTVVRLVKSEDDPFPKLRETGHQAHSGPRGDQKSLAAHLMSRRLSIGGHVIDRPEVKTTYVDTHCHLATALRILKDLQRLDDKTIPDGAIDIYVKTIFPKEVTACIDISSDPFSDYHEKAIALDWPEHFKYYFAVGGHPHDAVKYTDEIHDGIVAIMSNPSCVGWGKCGLDYVKNSRFTHATQRSVFKRQLAAAVLLNKPIIIHTREADEDTLACIREIVPENHHMHFHCYTSGRILARSILEEYPNSFIGITGVVTYLGVSHIHDMIRSGQIPLERILLETDSPHMVPRSVYAWLQREKPVLARKTFVISHAGMIPFTAERLMETLNEGRLERGEAEVRLEEILEVTRNNAAKMYRIDV